VLAALFVGGMIPVVFSAMAMKSVGKAAMEMVQEVRRQFREIPGIMEGTGTPEYGKCVEISTQAALKEMLLPGLLTIVTPIVVGLFFGAEPLGGYMAGVCVSGVMWAIFQNNAGGAWDNAKKSFEAGVEINGEMTYKGSDAHKAAVTGDTVGDPFKDTSGPSMNILIKLTCLVGLVIAPILGGHHEGAATEGHAMMFVSEDGTVTELGEVAVQKEQKVTVIMEQEGEAVKATVTTITEVNGELQESVQVFEGTEEEVRAEVEALEAMNIKIDEVDGEKVIEVEVEQE